MAELDLADGIVLVQESTSINIQQEVDVATQYTKGLRSRQDLELPSLQLAEIESMNHTNNTSAAATGQQSSWPPWTKKCRIQLVKKDVEAICEELMSTKPEEILPKVIFISTLFPQVINCRSM